MRIRPVIHLLVLSIIALALPLAPADETSELPRDMARLAPLIGQWRAERVEFLDTDGNVTRVSSAEAHNTARLGGLAVHHRGRLDEPEIHVEGWYQIDPATGRLEMASVSSAGRYDVFTGAWDEDRLVLTTRARDGESLRFRLVVFDIRPDSFRERLEASRDGGRTWGVSSRQRFTRIDW